MTVASDRMLAAVRAALGSEPRLSPARRGLRLDLDDGVLTMEGEVADAGSKKIALERAAAVRGIHHIVDRLRVTPARRMTDAEIRDHIRDALTSEPVFRGYAVSARAGAPPHDAGDVGAGRMALEVSVVDAAVTLAGRVPSLAHKRLAGVVAWWVPGTRDVVNGLEVVPPEEDGDDELRDGVVLALEKDPLVDAADIRVNTSERRVTLEGAVASPEQREMAELDAWCVFGVDRVVNHLVVRAREHAPVR